jgi:hypothetical protein
MGNGAGTDTGYGIALDGAGNAYVAGGWGGSGASPKSDFDPGPGVARLTLQGTQDVFVVKLAPVSDGSLQFSWAKDMGGKNANACALAAAVDGAGNVYTTGRFNNSVDFDPGSGAYTLQSAGDFDIFVSKLDTNGNFAAAARMGSGGNLSRDDGYGIAVDGSGNVYSTGDFMNTADFDPTAGTYSLTSHGSFDIFVSKLTQSSPLLAAGGAVAGTRAPGLTDAHLQPIVAAAIDRWAAAGMDAGRLDLMRQATVSIANLGGSYLGLADAGTNAVRIDDDAAGYGWFVDATPADDSEFRAPGAKGVRNRMDLLSVVALSWVTSSASTTTTTPGTPPT